MSNVADLLNLEGKVAVVTGAAGGIGLGIAKRLAEAGVFVLLADINKDLLAAAVKEVKTVGKASGAVVDMTKSSEVCWLMETAVKKFGGLDILVNNAGIYPNVPVLEMTEADFDKVISLNLRGLYLACKAAAEVMIGQNKGGKIINITSIDALHPSAVGLAHYDASKHGAWGFTKNLALELAPHQIWVNAIAPGGINTPGVQAASSGLDQQAQKKMMETFMAKIPMKRIGEPDDIAKVALFLASDMASYMTGSQIVVDGGVLLG